MEEDFFSPAYKGSKKLRQQDIRTANATGFGAAADDYAERGIDLNEQLIMNKAATFFFRMAGDAMTGAGIQSGDVLIVDRSIAPSNGKIIVAAVDGELYVRRFQKTIKGIALLAEGGKTASMPIGEFTQYQCWGVVTGVVHLLEPSLRAYRNNNSSAYFKTSR